jgi:hypothetical protein
VEADSVISKDVRVTFSSIEVDRMKTIESRLSNNSMHRQSEDKASSLVSKFLKKSPSPIQDKSNGFGCSTAQNYARLVATKDLDYS